MNAKLHILFVVLALGGLWCTQPQHRIGEQAVELTGVVFNGGGWEDDRKPTTPLDPPDCMLVLEGEPRSFVHPGRAARCETPLGTHGEVRFIEMPQGTYVFSLIFEE